jgi:GGDEF domain-containing protein
LTVRYDVLILEPRLDRAELLTAACEEAAPAVARFEHIRRRDDVFALLAERPAVLLASVDDAASFETVLRILRLFPRQPVIAVMAEGDPAWEARLIQEGIADALAESEIEGQLLVRRLRHLAARSAMRDSGDAFPMQDPLTGLLNRGTFLFLGDRKLAKAQQRPRTLTLAAIEVRGWREILFSQGALAADELIAAAAQCLQAKFNRSLAARVGPAEFAFLAAGVEPNAMRASVAEANMSLRQMRGAGAAPAVCEAGVAESGTLETLTELLAAAQSRCREGIVAFAAGT